MFTFNSDGRLRDADAKESSFTRKFGQCPDQDSKQPADEITPTNRLTNLDNRELFSSRTMEHVKLTDHLSPIPGHGAMRVPGWRFANERINDELRTIWH